MNFPKCGKEQLILTGNNMNDKKLFIVEFGKPDVISSFSFIRTEQPPVFVLACSYDEAVEKAIIHVESNAEPKSVIGPDGSLLNLDHEPLTIKSVRLACNEIVI